MALLQGPGSAQMLEDEAHRHRKALFLGLADQTAAEAIAALLTDEWQRRIAKGELHGDIVLFDLLRDMLTTAVLHWAGIPLDERSRRKRRVEFSAMIENTGTVGPGAWRALWLRKRSEGWGMGLIRAARGSASTDSPLAVIATHRDLRGELLDEKTAAIELLNILRPVVAVARFVVYAAAALHRHPEWRERLAAAADAEDLHAFVEEVRRTAAFFPMIGGRVRERFEWRGRSFTRGEWVLLDLYGTNHDERSFPRPYEFDPARFVGRPPDLFEFVPQGAGEPARTHRCPGEAITREVMKAACRLLCRARYDVPEQDLSVDLARIPALPRSGFIVRKMRMS